MFDRKARLLRDVKSKLTDPIIVIKISKIHNEILQRFPYKSFYFNRLHI